MLDTTSSALWVPPFHYNFWSSFFQVICILFHRTPKLFSETAKGFKKLWIIPAGRTNLYVKGCGTWSNSSVGQYKYQVLSNSFSGHIFVRVFIPGISNTCCSLVKRSIMLSCYSNSCFVRYTAWVSQCRRIYCGIVSSF